MPQLFRPRADVVLRIVLLLAAVLGVGGLAVAVSGTVDLPGLALDRGAPTQPAGFSHALHVGHPGGEGFGAGLGLDCRHCHMGVTRAANAGYPPMRTCATCHLALNPRPRLDWSVAWVRVQDLPDHVYFHHGIHVARGIGCATCHGDVAGMREVYPVRRFSMAWCLDCHRDPAPHLNPPDSVFTAAATGDHPGGDALLAAWGIDPSRLDHCYVCHR